MLKWRHVDRPWNWFTMTPSDPQKLQDFVHWCDQENILPLQKLVEKIRNLFENLETQHHIEKQQLLLQLDSIKEFDELLLLLDKTAQQQRSTIIGWDYLKSFIKTPPRFLSALSTVLACLTNNQPKIQMTILEKSSSIEKDFNNHTSVVDPELIATEPSIRLPPCSSSSRIGMPLPTPCLFFKNRRWPSVGACLGPFENHLVPEAINAFFSALIEELNSDVDRTTSSNTCFD